MESSIGQLRGLLAEHYALGLLATAVIFLVALTTFSSRGQPQRLVDPIPYVYNTVQFLTNNEKFMNRAT